MRVGGCGQYLSVMLYNIMCHYNAVCVVIEYVIGFKVVLFTNK